MIQMKNRLIYSLVALMVISLVGIIVLQSLWVSNAISDQEREFESQVNAALNDVNSSIEEEEALFFWEGELAKLADTSEFFDLMEAASQSEYITAQNRIEISLKENVENVRSKHVLVDSLNKEDKKRVIKQLQVQVKNEDNLSDSITIITENELNKLDDISTVVRRYVMEHDFSGNLSDRISKSTLDSLIKKEVRKQGIKLQPEYAVYRKGSNESIPGYASKSFDKSKKKTSFTKRLFPKDRLLKNDFELFVQFSGTSGLVWSGVQWIVIMCVLFTLLILICFVYSLHFIFKQKRLSQVKNDFINNMTHELKTPLASISLAASSIQHPNVIGKPEEIERLIAIIRSEEKRMNEHVERVLDMAALEYQELKMNREHLDLIALIHESIKHIQLSVEAVNGKLVFSTQLDSVYIHADKFHLLSAFINILDNSVKYQNGGLEIAIHLIETSSHYLIEFADNGIGMKKVAVKRAFDKFYREETGNIHTRKGFGLGLSYVKSIIELHDGLIDLTSEVNRGTVVKIKLPKS